MEAAIARYTDHSAHDKPDRRVSYSKARRAVSEQGGARISMYDKRRRTTMIDSTVEELYTHDHRSKHWKVHVSHKV